jgi:hypothetical protein
MLHFSALHNKFFQQKKQADDYSDNRGAEPLKQKKEKDMFEAS